MPQKSFIQITVEDIAIEGVTAAVKLLHFEGQLDESNIDEEAAAVNGVVSALPDGAFMILDLEKLDYLNSKSIGYLTYWHVTLQHGGGQLILVAARDNVTDILNVVGLTQLVTMLPSLDDAGQYIAKASKATKS